MCGRLPLSICDRYDWLIFLPVSASNALHQLLLRERTIQSAERTFDLAQVANFFAQCHICQIAIIISQYEILSRNGLPLFAMGYARLSVELARTPRLFGLEKSLRREAEA
jgi:hypothetical protein